MPMAPIVSLVSAGKTIALLEPIFYITRIIVDKNANDGVHVPSKYHNLTQRLQDLQTLVHNGLSSIPVARVSGLYALLENYHCIISTIQSHINSGPMDMELTDECARYVDDFRKEFELQVSPLIVDNHRGQDMFRNCKNFIISGGNFVATIPDIHPQTSANDKLFKLAYVHISILLFSTAGHM